MFVQDNLMCVLPDFLMIASRCAGNSFIEFLQYRLPSCPSKLVFVLTILGYILGSHYVDIAAYNLIQGRPDVGLLKSQNM
jgi:hypothetical protein